MLEQHFASRYPEDSRFEQIQSILRLVKEGNSSQVIGLPGAGKSNILELLAYNKHVRIKHLGEEQTKFHFIFTNFSEVRNKPLLDVMKFLFLELADSLEERGMEEEHEAVKKILKESLEYQDSLILFQGMKKAIDYLTGQKQLTIVILFDRFETYIPTVTSEFFSNLRILRNRAKYQFSVVFSLDRPLEEILEPAMLADYYEFIAGHTVFVPLKDKPLQTFRIKHLEEATGKTIDHPTLQTILTLTAGHGKLLRTCIESVFAQTTKGTNLTPEFFLSHKPVFGALAEIWYFLTPSEQALLLEQTNKQIENSFLEKTGLLKNGNITIPLFETFVQEQAKNLFESSQKLAFDPAANTIKKGAITLSDTLTISEFRLLSFLLQHPNEIIDRDAVIQSVWKDAKATAGVTDQAIDQLIFRLRKKIENDPNNPQHLQTIKGRGVKFAS